MTELVPYQQPQSSIELAPAAWKIAEKIAGTDFVPPALRGRPEAVLACILAGHEAGVSPMQALSKIHVIEGRPAMSAELMRALVMRQGHEIIYEEVSTTKVVAAGRRKGSDRWTKVTWTMDDARRGGLDGKQNWRKWPRAMLIARATAELCRMVFPDVLAGISYTIEELSDGDQLPGDLDYGPAEIPQATPPAKARAQASKNRTKNTPSSEPETRELVSGEIPDLPDLDIQDAEVVELVPTEPPLEPDEAMPDLPPPRPSRSAPIETTATEHEPDDWPSADWPTEAPPEPERRYSGPQIIAIKLADRFGIKGNTEAARALRLAAISFLLRREVTSSKDLAPADVQEVIALIDEWPEGRPLFPPEEPDTVGTVPSEETPAAEAVTSPAPEVPEPQPEQPPRRERPLEIDDALPDLPPARRERPLALVPATVHPEEWTGDRWRTFLAERKVKVTELMREAGKLGAAMQPKVSIGTLDDIAGSGIAVDLVGWVEDRSLGGS